MTEEIKKAKIVAPEGRSKTVDLDWPVEFDGAVWDKITVRRVTGREVEQFLRDIGGGENSPQPPMIDCPPEVYEALDDDDLRKVEEEMLPFLPRRLKALVESTLVDTESTPAE